MGRLPVLLILISFAACQSDTPDASFETTDSAGVLIAESSAPAWGTGEGWRVSEEPALQIGVQEGDSHYQLFQAFAAKRFPDGRIAILNYGLNLIRFYDADGRFLREVGGPGEGPGEFRRLGSFSILPGDSIMAFDHGLRRVTVFAPDGSFARSADLIQPGTEPLSGVSPLTDGSVLITTSWSSAMLGPNPTDGIHRDPMLLLRYAPTGELLDTVRTFPGPEILVTRSSMGSTPFGRYTAVAIHGDLIYVGTADRMEILGLTLDGQLARIIRVPDLDLMLTEEEIEWFREGYRERILADAPDEDRRRAAERRLDEMEFPELRPAHGRLMLDEEGNIWAGPYEGYAWTGTEWTVFDAEGRLLGTVIFPEEVRIMDIGSDYILGVWQNEYDVEYARLYDLIKP